MVVSRVQLMRTGIYEVAGAIKAMPRPEYWNSRAYLQPQIERLRDVMASSSFDQLLSIGSEALSGQGAGYKGFDKLQLLFESAGKETALWALDCLDRRRGIGPMPAEESALVLSDECRGTVSAKWAPVIDHDLNNNLGLLFGFAELQLRSESYSTKRAFSGLLQHINIGKGIIAAVGKGALSNGLFLSQMDSLLVRMQQQIEESDIYISPDVLSGTRQKLENFGKYLGLYRDYPPEQLVVSASALTLQYDYEVARTNYEKAANMLLGQREDPGSVLSSMLTLAGKRKQLGHDKYYDGCWIDFLRTLKEVSPEGLRLYEEVSARFIGIGSPMEEAVIASRDQ